MRRLTAFALAALVFTCFAPGVSTAEPITYTFDDNPINQSGFHVLGTITTDGTIGMLTSANIESWSFTFTDPNNVTVGTASSQGAHVTVLSGDVSATMTSITADVFFPTGFAFILEDMTTRVSYALVEAGATLYTTEGVGPTGRFWDNVVSGSSVEVAHVESAVPEPGTLTLALVGIGGLVGTHLARRRRAAATRPSACPPAHS